MWPFFSGCLIPGTAGVPALAVGAALALTTLAPARHQASDHPWIQLAAWTVVQQPGGKVKVTIRELHDPAGLQAGRRADGYRPPPSSSTSKTRRVNPWPGAALHGEED